MRGRFRFYYTRSIGGPAWSPDGTEIAFTMDTTGRPNLWKVPAEGGWPVQLSVSEDREYGAAWSPDGKYFTYAIDDDGRIDAYLVDRANGRAHPLDFPPGLTEPDGTPNAFSPKGDRLLVGYESSREPGDLWVFDPATGRRRQLTFASLASLDPAKLPQA